MVSHVAAAFLTGFIVYSALPGSSLFSWHPTFMCIAFVLLMFESIMLFSPQSSLMWSSNRQTKGEIHGYVMVASAVCAGLGFAAIFYNKHIHEKPHFTSWHGLIGIITLGYISLQLMGGVFLKYNATLSQLLKIHIRLADLKLYHATSGLVGFTFVSCSLLLGLWTDWFISVSGDVMWWLCLGCLSCISIIVMNQVTAEYMPQTRRPAPGSKVTGSKAAGSKVAGGKVSKKAKNR